MKNIRRWMFSTILLVMLFSMSDFGTAPTLSKKSLALKAGTTKTLTVKNTKATVTWSSSNKKVATVKKKGNTKAVVTAVSKGTAVIKAKVGSKTLSCKVTVKNTLVKKMVLSATRATLTVGGKLRLKAKIFPSKATLKDVTWTSSKKAVATVTKKGIVVARKRGKAVITAVAQDGSNVKASCKLTVKNPVVSSSSAKYSISADGSIRKIGDTVQLGVKATPSTVKTTFTWSSSDTDVATVSKSGLVKVIGYGSATITATSTDGNGTTLSYKINLPDPGISSLEITTDDDIPEKIGGTMQLHVKTVPAKAVRTYTWKSSNKKVATVDSNGYVTFVGKGKVTITATSNKGETVSVTFTFEPWTSSEVEDDEPANTKKLTGIDAVCSIEELGQGGVFDKSKLTVYDIFEDGSKEKTSTYSASIKYDANNYRNILTVTKPGTSFSKEIIIKEKEISKIEGSCSISEAKTAAEVTASSFNVYKIYKDGTKVLLTSYNMNVSVSSDYFTVTFTTKDGKYSDDVNIKRIKDSTTPSEPATLTSITATFKYTSVSDDYKLSADDFTVIGTFSDGTKKEVAFTVKSTVTGSTFKWTVTASANTLLIVTGTVPVK